MTRTKSFGAVFHAVGTTTAPTAVQAPQMNAICERLTGLNIRSIATPPDPIRASANVSL